MLDLLIVFLSCLFRQPSDNQSGIVLMFGGYSPSLMSLDDLYLLGNYICLDFLFS